MGAKEQMKDKVKKEKSVTLEEEKKEKDATTLEDGKEEQQVIAGEDAEETEESIEVEESQNYEEGEEDTTGEKKSKSFFKKDKKKDKKDQQIEELNDRLVRTMAEFDNYRKRSEKEKSQMFELGSKDIIEKVLPVIDNFERGLNSITEEEKEGAFAKGIEAIYKQFLATLEGAGVKQIEAVGKVFDPNFHNAVMHVEDEEHGESEVVEEFQKGYMYRDIVVRHSMVKVAN